MARIRTIKPEFWTSEQIVECSLNARRLFIGIWDFFEDSGVHPASVRRLKMEVFPGDDLTIEAIQAMVDELHDNRLLREYSVDGQAFWLVSGFTRHQKIDRPTFRFPLPDDTFPSSKSVEHSSTPRRDIDDHSESDHPRSLRESKGRESNSKERLIEFCRIWNEWHEAGIVSKKIRNVDDPSTTIVSAWNRGQKDKDQRERLDNLDAVRTAIEFSVKTKPEFLNSSGWFDAAGLVGGRNSTNRRFYCEMLLNGAYADKCANSADDDWAAVHEIVRTIYQPDIRNEADVEAKLTAEQFAAAKSVTLKRIANADRFDKPTAAAYREARKAVA